MPRAILKIQAVAYRCRVCKHDRYILYTDSRTHAYETLHDEKITALDGLIESATSPLLIFYYFASDLDRIILKVIYRPASPFCLFLAHNLQLIPYINQMASGHFIF